MHSESRDRYDCKGIKIYEIEKRKDFNLKYGSDWSFYFSFIIDFFDL